MRGYSVGFGSLACRFRSGEGGSLLLPADAAVEVGEIGLAEQSDPLTVRLASGLPAVLSKGLASLPHCSLIADLRSFRSP